MRTLGLHGFGGSRICYDPFWFFTALQFYPVTGSSAVGGLGVFVSRLWIGMLGGE